MSRGRLYAIYVLSGLYALTWLNGIARNDLTGLTQATPALIAMIGFLVAYDRRNGRNGARA